MWLDAFHSRMSNTTVIRPTACQTMSILTVSWICYIATTTSGSVDSFCILIVNHLVYIKYFTYDVKLTIPINILMIYYN